MFNFDLPRYSLRPFGEGTIFEEDAMMTADFEAYLADDWYGHPITVDALLECEAEAGIEMAVVMPSTKPVPDNDGLLDKTAAHPQLLPCPLMDPRLGDAGIAAMRDYVERGARGIKLMGVIHEYNVDDPMVIPFVEAARDLGIVVSIHSGRDNCSAERVGRVAEQVPDVPIIMDHMGFPDGFDVALAVCKQCPDVYLGTTILRFHKLWANNPEEAVPYEVKRAVDELGAERVVFGSNLPEYRPIQVKRAIQRLALGDEAEALIFGANLGRIYGM